MENLEELKKFATNKSDECKIQSAALSKWLRTLTPANLIFVVGASLLSLVAGSSMLLDNGLIERMHAGLMALVSGGFTVIHSKLGCDEHQAECRRLESAYRGMAEDYSN
jgi:hypothetical protein